LTLLSPEAKRSHFFGLLALMENVSAILGPLLYGIVTLLFAETVTLANQLALGSLAVPTAIRLWITCTSPIGHKKEPLQSGLIPVK
jgi:UMF1 family MFS transporter